MTALLSSFLAVLLLRQALESGFLFFRGVGEIWTFRASIRKACAAVRGFCVFVCSSCEAVWNGRASILRLRAVVRGF